MNGKKRKVVLAALICTLAVAVYLNWQFSGNDLSATTGLSGNSEKQLGDTKLVNGNSSSISEKSYFAEARTNREKSRDEALAILKETIDNVKLSDEDKKDALKQANDIAKAVELEGNIENLIKAKKYDDAVAVISNGEITVIIKADELTATQVTEITDIVTTAADITSDKIKLVTAK